jgi:choloylglycine hydrolase
MCTGLVYIDAKSRPYLGNTMELSELLPWQMAYFPAGTSFTSQVAGKDPLTWTSKYSVVGMSVSAEMPQPGVAVDCRTLVVARGMNDSGLALSHQAYNDTGETPASSDTAPMLEATQLGQWLLGNFTTVADVKAALATQPVNATKAPMMGMVPFPLHLLVTDHTGASIVIEGKDGAFIAHDNPVGAMTNGPYFEWHLTNLNNWTQLSNVDQSSATFGTATYHQPDSGIATSGLPSSNASVGRFIRAVYYTQFVDKFDDPDVAVSAVASILNNFDRPRGASSDAPGSQSEGANFGGGAASPKWSTEYTTHSILCDIARARFYIRRHAGLNWSMADLTQLTGLTSVVCFPMTDLPLNGEDLTAALLKAGAVAPAKA